MNIKKAKIYNIIKKSIYLSLKLLFFQNYDSSFMTYSVIKESVYVTSTIRSKP